MARILLAGATGYLGGFIARELQDRKYHTRVVVRDVEKFEASGCPADEVVRAEVTDRASLQGCCDNVDMVVSAVGITKQKDGLTYMDVDYQANLNLLEAAQQSGVKKFVYVSVLNGASMTQLQICRAKEKFVEALKGSGLEFCIIRPNGFFSDMAEFHAMAARGRVYLFGDGQYKSNPIHGQDLARVCVGALKESAREIDVGGPEVLTQNEIAGLAFAAVGKSPKVTFVPDWVRRFVLVAGRICLSAPRFGPVEFFMHVMTTDMVAPTCGEHTLAGYFQGLQEADPDHP
ncbi:SDR family oxidoreductase [Desulfoluna spongiiphila]|uniref:Uncharacterized conserved protein YbjT, contains NAD(P)-binding and DUF2867 domains n=1 Tax=Desulfoluna spongiiphila TaxID=419481 RepID=A0A1G5EQX3_9BACT|nr:SDR family oxidoreductase [Desulfoluna spongiiphila]SCY29366.1 Uncharacterized conserved protein YbjT, contains NAD(P)-binding and DUF2867 domains [Desulfoluna spongiiphila]VVS91284.1 nad(p)-binding domain [Desulfoluna spongiiphila]